MESRSIFFALGVLAAGTVFAEAYTWTDENGVVHYSDRPHPGAKTIDLPEQQRGRPVPARAQSSSGGEDGAPPPVEFSYESLDVASPGPEETLWNIGGVLSVSLNLQPGLQPGHQVRVYFDGTPRMVNGTSFQIEEVHRGVHNVQVEIIDDTGQLMIRSRTNRFYVQQNSVR